MGYDPDKEVVADKVKLKNSSGGPEETIDTCTFIVFCTRRLIKIYFDRHALPLLFACITL